jgi:serine phosphatase RsbU (regulator of sigma subunit)
MSFRRIFAIAFLLFALGAALVVAGLLGGHALAIQLGFESVLLAFLWLGFHILRRIFQRLLFRVGNRLFVSYVLIGVLPMLMVFCLAGLLVYLLTGQLAVRRAERELQQALQHLRDKAAAMSQGLEPGSDALARRALFAAGRPAAGLGWALRPLAGELDGEGPLDPALLLPEGRVQTGLEAVGRLGKNGTHFLAVVAPPTAAGSLVVYQQIEPELRRQIEDATHASISFPQARLAAAKAAEEGAEPDMQVEVSGGAVDFRFDGRADDPDRTTIRTFEKDPPLVAESGLVGKPIVYFPRSVELPYIDWTDDDWHSAIEDDDNFNMVAQTSVAREYLALFDSATADDINTAIGENMVALPLYLAMATLTLYFLAAVIAGVLVYRIARATSYLHYGFTEVEKGNFQVDLTFRGKDQLAGLVASFNRMARHLAGSLEERAQREAIERELEIARQLQRSLLPPADYCAPGFEIAADFVPAAAIGGDFYHFSGWSDGRLLVAIADVSGHGLSTGIVMSAAKALLSALSTDYCPCPELLRRLDRELRSHTGRRNFVTLALCAFDRARGRLELSNAGHPYPYRLQADGCLTAIENPSRPLAVGLPQDFRSVTAEVAAGDLFVLYSDGVIEAQAPSGEVFGFERFENLLKTCAGKTAAETRDCVLDAWRSFTGTNCPEDDRTLLVLKVLD